MQPLIACKAGILWVDSDPLVQSQIQQFSDGFLIESELDCLSFGRPLLSEFDVNRVLRPTALLISLVTDP